MYLDPALTVLALILLALAVVLLRSTKVLDRPQVNATPTAGISEPMADADRDKLLLAIRANAYGLTPPAGPEIVLRVTGTSFSSAGDNRYVVHSAFRLEIGDTLVVSKIKG